MSQVIVYRDVKCPTCHTHVEVSVTMNVTAGEEAKLDGLPENCHPGSPPEAEIASIESGDTGDPLDEKIFGPLLDDAEIKSTAVMQAEEEARDYP